MQKILIIMTSLWNIKYACKYAAPHYPSYIPFQCLISKILAFGFFSRFPLNMLSSVPVTLQALGPQLLLCIQLSSCACASASGSPGLSQPSTANHPFPRHSSSRQPLQQINLLLTVHLDWINLELRAITEIDSQRYSQDSVCYPLCKSAGFWID